MPNYSYPGVYIQEVKGGPAPINGASPSTLAVVGFTLEGPVNEPTLVTSFTEFAGKFGSFTAAGITPTAAFGYFQNGGQQLRVVRVVGAGAAKADGALGEGISTGNLTPDGDAPDGAVLSFQFTGVNALAALPVVPADRTETPTTDSFRVNVSAGVTTVAAFVDENSDGSLTGS